MTDPTRDHEQAVERLIADITQVEGRVVTSNDEAWLRWRVADLHVAVAASDDPPSLRRVDPTIANLDDYIE